MGGGAGGALALPIERRREAPFGGFSTNIGASGDDSIAAAAGMMVSGGGGGGGVATGVLAFSMFSGDAVMGLGESAFLIARASVGVAGF